MAIDFNRRGMGGNPFSKVFEKEPMISPPSFEYIPPEITEAVELRKEANNALSSATDQYEADVADFKNTQANDFEQGLASLLDEMEFPRIPGGGGIDYGGGEGPPIYMPPPDFGFPPDVGGPVMPPFDGFPPFDGLPPFDGFPPVNGPPPFDGFPPFDGLPPGGNPYDGIFPPMDPPYDGLFPPIDNLPPINFPPIDGPPYDPPMDPPPMDPPLPPPPTPPPPPPSGPSEPINPYTGLPISNPYTPYATDSGAAPLTRAISPEDFGEAPGFERPVGGPPITLPPAPPEPPIEPPIMCFVAGTKVDMADGTKKVIENIAVGDEVMALGDIVDKVSYVHDIPEDNRHLWTINNRITATDSHAFLTKDGWKSNNSELSNKVYNTYGIDVKDLQVGDELITNDGVEKVTTLESEKDFVKVYNFTTSNTHTYMVDGVVSHNKLPPIQPPGRGPDPRPIRRSKIPKDMKNGGGISMLPMNGQGDTLTTQVFQSGFRPRR